MLCVCGVQYQGQTTEYGAALDYMNIFFTGVFTVECCLKLVAFRVKVS